mgnify:CR=1 FL=1
MALSKGLREKIKKFDELDTTQRAVYRHRAIKQAENALDTIIEFLEITHTIRQDNLTDEDIVIKALPKEKVITALDLYCRNLRGEGYWPGAQREDKLTTLKELEEILQTHTTHKTQKRA